MQKEIVKFWWIALVIKITLATFLPLFNDEAYYWVWSHNLQLSYFDHPPFISWLYLLGQPFENFFNSVRIPSVILGHLTLWVWLKIAENLLTATMLKWFFWLSLFMPFFGPASLIATPDLPLLFFWSLSLYFLLDILQGKNNWKNFSFLGLSLGLGFCSKYPMVLTAPLFFTAWYFVGTKKFFYNLKNPLFMVAFFILGSLPVFWWNIANDFESFRFQINHGVGAKSWKYEWTLTYLLAQLAIISPLVFYYAFVNKEKNNRIRIIKCAAWTPLIFFFITSFKGRVEANWPIMAHPAILLLALSIPHRSMSWIKGTLVFWIILFTSVYINFFFPFLPFKKLNEYKKYDAIEKVVGKYQPLYGRTFQMSAQLSFKSKQQIYKLKGMNRFDFYDSLDLSKPTENTFYLATKKGDSLPKEWVEQGYNVTDKILLDETYTLLKVGR